MLFDEISEWVVANRLFAEAKRSTCAVCHVRVQAEGGEMSVDECSGGICLGRSNVGLTLQFGDLSC